MAERIIDQLSPATRKRYEALLPAFAEEWEATEQIGGYNALMDKVRNSRYNEYYTEL